ncbi:spike base protein, RCAP_Rcc01079 family [Fimbriiglobus ruber]|uniref:Phage protein n=1 Tax=Fimbriiglobus ruber TaxID=1908690 RepID=A0A225DCD8_9BACT|nr:hypothetical protein [Fimbriiglobus ruber]OWK34966.1 hypothetical protein FRUB_09808 [Fimbriiglobus ruber]
MSAVNNFASLAPSFIAPATHAQIVTPSDTVDLTYVTRFISITAAGAVAVTTQDGDTLTIPSGAILPGYPFPIAVSRIFATGTTAAGIVAFS